MSIEELYNRLYYSIFKWANMEPLDKPINWLFDNCFYKLPFVVRRLKNLGYTVEEYKQLFSDKKGKMTLHDKRLSSQIMVVCMAMTMIELFYLFTILTGRDNWYAGDNTKTHTIIIYFSLGFCVLLAEWYYIDRKSKYKRYFKKFEKETRKKHIVWQLLTLTWGVSASIIFYKLVALDLL
ncbi:MAG: hypothetical protein II275_00065 [Bacteroidaceae bacterium]|nr:hypothetical protein [Bacteroidaceae bacterium]